MKTLTLPRCKDAFDSFRKKWLWTQWTINATLRTRQKKNLYLSMSSNLKNNLESFTTQIDIYWSVQSMNAMSKSSSAQLFDQPNCQSSSCMIGKSVLLLSLIFLNMKNLIYLIDFLKLFQVQQTFLIGSKEIHLIFLSFFVHCSLGLDMMLIVFMVQLQNTSRPKMRVLWKCHSH